MIKTDRLTFRIVTNGDVEAIFKTLNYQRTAENIVFLQWPITLEQAEQWCQRSKNGYKSKKEYIFLVESKQDKMPIGCIGLHLDEDDKNMAETGYWLDETEQGKGYAFEMLSAIIDFAHKQNIKTLKATTSMDNIPSQHLLKKTNFKDGSVIDITKPNGSTRKSKVFLLDMTEHKTV